MRDKRKLSLANRSNYHDWTIGGGIIVCARCGKYVVEVDGQEDPAVCWADVAESYSPYLIHPQVKSAHPIESGEDIWVGDEWWPLSIKATDGER